MPDGGKRTAAITDDAGSLEADRQGTLTPAPGELARDHPEAYIARDRRHALAEHLEMADRVRGAGLFADISGFTPLTEALADELGSRATVAPATSSS